MSKRTTSDASAVSDFYNKTAADYSAMMDEEVRDELYTDVLSRLAERLEGVLGLVVDTSCGGGQMLVRYLDFDSGRPVLGIDISSEMVELTEKALGDRGGATVGDMRELDSVGDGAAAAVISYFALHHLDAEELEPTLREWHRALGPGGQLVLAAWNGTGAIDYGDAASIVALFHPIDELEELATDVGFEVTRSSRKLDESLGLEALYIEASKVGFQAGPD